MAHSNYLTYAEYQAYGGTLTSAAFVLLEFKSRKRVDYLTDTRVQDMENVPDAVKLCMYALINMDAVVGAEAQASAPTVTSFSTDGYSETYGHSFDAATANKQMDETAKMYLYGETDDDGIPLLYRGVR